MSAATPIFVPGLLCTEILFQQQRAALGRDDRLADTTKHDSITAMAAAALALVDGPIVPIGLSMGGYVAQEMARQAPDRVVGMALLSTNCRADTAEQTSQREAAIKLAAHKGFQGVTRHLLPRLLSDPAQQDKALVDAVLTMARDIGRHVFADQQRAIMGRRAQHDTLAGFDAPLLVLCGKLDVLTPPELSVEMASLAPNADLCLLDGVGHLSSMEAPDAVTEALRGLLAKIV